MAHSEPSADSASAAGPSACDLAAAPAAAGRRALLAVMPKAEPHLHLDGSVLPETALDLARTRGVDAPSTLEGMRRVLVAPAHGTSQAELLRAFDLPIALMQDAEALERITAELVAAKAAERVRYLEIRWAPMLHTARGLTVPDGIAAVCRGAAAGAAATGSTVRLICTAMRSHPPETNVSLARAAAHFREQGLTGFDLAGPEAAFPDPLVHGRAFETARQDGLRITVHAGEWGGAGQVRRALALRPERIGHGPGAVEDMDLCAELIRRGVTLDLGPTSNVQAGMFPSRTAHPLAILYRRAVSVTLSTDDRTVSDVTLTDEFGYAIDEIGLRLDELWAINRHAFDVAFAPETDLELLRAEFDAWAAARRELTPRGRTA